ncbi:hypothetical protein AJ80_05372 [Polytolypa hystricis UAMH7299]|uniref:Uncharacterized protein n=1 Tax=Polytolypa hystricis (strain UAMH7299) TaxID=1447883 RepID=A0A2B7Y3C4_POLH7|nr:hypothetical protein AJ80_05372 [Polytolypa hystricis UAMH7299]
MADKRKTPSSESTDPPSAKRRARSFQTNEDGEGNLSDTPTTSSTLPIKPTPYQQPRNDPVFGQKHAFPGLDDGSVGDDELFYGPPEDGIEYLRMVRSEARTLPSVFVSQETLSKIDNDNNNTQPQSAAVQETTSLKAVRGTGYFSDGVYVAPPPSSHLANSKQEQRKKQQQQQKDFSTTPDAQEIYYNLLRHRFLLLRSTLKCIPPPSIISALDNTSHPISLPAAHKKARAEWHRLLRTVDPQPAQLACMDNESVLRVLDIVTRTLSEAARSGDAVRVKRLGAWAWGLLGRCRDVGQLGSEDVSDIRELGKRAVKILKKVREAERRVEVEGEGEGGEGGYGEGRYDSEDGEGESFMMEDEGESVAGRGNEVQDSAVDNEEVGNQEITPDEAGGQDNAQITHDELEAAKARLRSRLVMDSSATAEPTDDNLDEGEIAQGDDQRGGQQSRDDDDEADEEEDDDDVEDPQAEAKRNTRAMLDMIISVTGEFYGQRDLLEFRDMWDEGPIWM